MSGRRAFLAASAAVTGFTAGVAAASTTDASLVAMAAELRAIEAAYTPAAASPTTSASRRRARP